MMILSTSSILLSVACLSHDETNEEAQVQIRSSFLESGGFPGAAAAAATAAAAALPLSASNPVAALASSMSANMMPLQTISGLSSMKTQVKQYIGQRRNFLQHHHRPGEYDTAMENSIHHERAADAHQPGAFGLPNLPRDPTPSSYLPKTQRHLQNVFSRSDTVPHSQYAPAPPSEYTPPPPAQQWVKSGAMPGVWVKGKQQQHSFLPPPPSDTSSTMVVDSLEEAQAAGTGDWDALKSLKADVNKREQQQKEREEQQKEMMESLAMEERSKLEEARALGRAEAIANMQRSATQAEPQAPPQAHQPVHSSQQPSSEPPAPEASQVTENDPGTQQDQPDDNSVPPPEEILMPDPEPAL